MSKQCLILTLLNLLQTRQLIIFCHNQYMHFCYWIFLSECNYFFVFKIHLDAITLAFNYFINLWLLQLFQSHFYIFLFFYFILLSIFIHRLVFTDSKNWACLAETGEDHIGIFVYGSKLLWQFSPESKRFNVDFEYGPVFTLLGQNCKICHFSDIIVHRGFRCFSNAAEAPWNVVVEWLSEFNLLRVLYESMMIEHVNFLLD